MKAMAITVLVGLLIAGAILYFGLPPQPKYRDKSLSEWIVRANDLDMNTRGVACEALGHFSANQTSATNQLLKTMNTDPSSRVRFIAGRAYYEVTHDAAPVITMASQEIRTRTASREQVDTGGLEVLVWGIGRAAQPIDTDLEDAEKMAKQQRDDAYAERLKEIRGYIQTPIDNSVPLPPPSPARR